MLKVGLLTPRSTLFPHLSTDWLSGLKNYLKHQGVANDFSLSIDNIGFGTDEQDIYSKAEKLLLQEDADVVVLFADNYAAEMLTPLFSATNKLLLVVNFGANFPDNQEPPPTVIYHSLNFCFHAGLTGKLAASAKSKNAINAVSYYDGGYRQCFCMLNGHQSNGGVPVFNHITHLRLSEFTLTPIAEFIQNNPGEATMLCLFSGDQAERFYHDIGTILEKHPFPLFVSPMMLDETLKLPMEMSGINASGYIPWHSSLDNRANTLFKEIFTKATGKSVNYFSLLGWETGMLLAMIREKYTGNNAAETVVLLNQEVINSPRGSLKVDANTHQIYGPSYLAVIRGTGSIALEGEMKMPDEEWQLFSAIKLGVGESSSWRNTYLCI